MAPETLQSDDDDLNQRLKEITGLVYGDRAILRLVDPAKLKLLTKNARYMSKPTFDQLAQNVADDGMLSSIPLVHPVKPTDNWKDCPDNQMEVLSGNHRCKSAVHVGLESIVVLLIPHQNKNEKIAKQISHNALAGEDDRQILAELWQEMEDIQAKLYSGLDSKMIDELEKITFQGFGAEPVRTERIALWFLPEEVEDLEKLLDECAEILASDTVMMAPIQKYEKLFNAIVKTKERENIKNTAVAFMRIIDLMHEANELAITREEETGAYTSVNEIEDTE